MAWFDSLFGTRGHNFLGAGFNLKNALSSEAVSGSMSGSLEGFQAGGPVGAIVGGIAGGAAGATENEQKLYDRSLDSWNQNFLQSQFNYSKYAYENAAQIHVRDLQKAGLSPLADSANGSFSSTGGVTQATQNSDIVNQTLNALRDARDFKARKEQQDLANAEQKRVNDSLIATQEALKAKAEAEKIGIDHDNSMKQKEYEYYHGENGIGVPPSADPTVRKAKESVKAVNDVSTKPNNTPIGRLDHFALSTGIGYPKYKDFDKDFEKFKNENKIKSSKSWFDLSLYQKQKFLSFFEKEHGRALYKSEYSR